MNRYRNVSVTVLAGGVGGARLARGFQHLGKRLTVVVNVGDDDEIYGLHVSPDLDTVVYTLAGIQGPQGWGIAGDTFLAMDQLSEIGTDTTFRIGDRDLATNIYRTTRLADGAPLSKVTLEIASRFGLEAMVIPATDAAVPTRIRSEGAWMSFQEYFVHRRHRDRVEEVDYVNADRAAPAPGVVEAISGADLVVIAPSNPVLSILPVLAIDGIHQAVAGSRRVVAISPLFGGRALKGPADAVLLSLGYSGGNQGVADAYGGLITDLVVDRGDGGERLVTSASVHMADTRLGTPEQSEAFANWLLATMEGPA